jgi:hypothetical protein
MFYQFHIKINMFNKFFIYKAMIRNADNFVQTHQLLCVTMPHILN